MLTRSCRLCCRGAAVAIRLGERNLSLIHDDNEERVEGVGERAETLIEIVCDLCKNFGQGQKAYQMEVRSQIDYDEALWRNNCLALGNEMGVKVVDNTVKMGWKCN